MLGLVAQVPYGRTTTYLALAHLAGLGPADARKIGAVLARNPALIIVPCHRVIAVDGSLTGDAGGLVVKRRLLDLESREQTPQLDLGWAGTITAACR